MKVHGLFRNAEETRHYAQGDAIFAEGDVGDEMFGVVSGEVELVVNGAVIAKLGPDEVFGEMAVIDSSRRMATALAAGDCEVAVIDRRRFLFLVHETPMFALQVMSTMAERLRNHG